MLVNPYRARRRQTPRRAAGHASLAEQVSARDGAAESLPHEAPWRPASAPAAACGSPMMSRPTEGNRRTCADRGPHGRACILARRRAAVRPRATLTPRRRQS